MLTEATRGEGVPELWEKLEAHRAYLEDSGQLEERRARNLAGEVFSVASARAKRHLEHAVADDPELRRLLGEVQTPRARSAERGTRDTGEGVPHWQRHETAPGLPEIEQARARLDGVARVTPVYRSETLSQLAGREVHLKAENLQRTGSFKVRGAYNRISTLSDEERAAGVVAASAGNHGQAVAWAAREVGSHARASSCRRTRRWRRSTRRATTAPRSS